MEAVNQLGVYMNKNVIIGLIAIAVIGVGGYVLYKNNNSSNNSTPSTSFQSSSSSVDQYVIATIVYSEGGFSPSTTIVGSGSVVAIKNASSDELQFSSNPHPIHTDNTELNVGAVAAGQTKSFTATKKGAFGFHNHLNPSDAAKITVE